MSILSEITDPNMPHLHRQHDDWLPREFVEKRLQILGRKLSRGAGLQPLTIENHITIAVDPSAIVWYSLTHSLLEENHHQVQWNDAFAGTQDMAFLVDGNHRARYVEEFVVNGFIALRDLALNARSDLETETLPNSDLINGMTRVIDQIDKTIIRNSAWLVQVFDASRLI